jgi:hypothetical protein
MERRSAADNSGSDLARTNGQPFPRHDKGRVADKPSRIIASAATPWEYNGAHGWRSPLAQNSVRMKSSHR